MDMSGSDFKALLTANKKKVLDVWAETKLSPQTIYNFINGEDVNESTKEALLRYAQKLQAARTGVKATAS
jgi:IS30 family transposase